MKYLLFINSFLFYIIIMGICQFFYSFIYKRLLLNLFDVRLNHGVFLADFYGWTEEDLTEGGKLIFEALGG